MARCRTHSRNNCSTCTQRSRERGFSNPVLDTTLFLAASSGDYGYGSTDYGDSSGGSSYGGGGGSSYSSDSGSSSSCGGGGGGE